jgi:hypothetical protein
MCGFCFGGLAACFGAWTLVCGSTVAGAFAEGEDGAFSAGAWLSAGGGAAFCGAGLGAGVGSAVCARTASARLPIISVAIAEARMRLIDTVLATRIVSIPTKATNEPVTREFESACRLAAD